MRNIVLSSFFLLCSFSAFAESPKGNVTVKLQGRLGNQLFEIATAYAYSLDHNLSLTVPDVMQYRGNTIPFDIERLSPQNEPSQSTYWKEPSFNYSPIPKAENILLQGYFQSEKYFKHRRAEILSLFAAPPGLNAEILSKYPFLSSNSLVIGVQIRDYRQEFPKGDFYEVMDRSFFEKAMQYFPEDAIFLVSTNNMSYAKECTLGLRENIIYLNEKDPVKEFYALVLCNSFIISNSSFGWWAAWLSTAEDKVTIAPGCWFRLPYNNQKMTKDLFPSNCISLKKE